MRLLVIDGNSIANRAFYGIKLLTTKDGRYTNAIFGFLNILLSLLKESEPDEVAVAFDLKAPTFRHKMYDGYKATRKPMPEELRVQVPVLKEVLAAMNIADQFFKEQEASENLRRQIKDGLDENAGLKMELSEAKREIFKLQTRK